jgi:hypothetical protein
MRRIWSCGLVFVALLALAPSVRAQDEPSVVIRVKSLDTVLQNLELLAGLVGREQAGQSIQDLIKAKVGAKGLQGIDLKRPVGAYIRFGKELEDISGAILVPVADEAAFLTLLSNLNLRPTKGKDGIYTLQTPQNIDFYLRFANQYAYVSGINTENLSDKNLLDPAKVLAGPDDSIISATVRLDQIPEGAKFLANATLKQQLEDLYEKVPPPETEAQKAFAKAAVQQAAKTVASVLNEGKRARFEVLMGKDKKNLDLQLSLTAEPNSELAKTLAAAGKTRSPFAGLMLKDAAFRGSVDATFPDAVQKTFGKAIEEAAQKGLADITDPAKRKQAQALLDALLPTVKTGELDAFFGMAGPVNNHYTLLAALKVKDGDKLGTVIQDLVTAELKNLTPEEQKKITLNAATVGTVKVHKFELPRDPKTNKVIEDLPGDPNLYVAFRKDALFLAIGPAALDTLKGAITTEEPAAAPLVLFDFNVARMAPTLAQTAEQKELARKLFTGNSDGTIRLAVAGGEALTLRMHIALDVLEFFAKMKGKE